jgi:hypothetical protein
MPDISHTIIAKSDQLNAGDLAQPITVEVRGVRVTRDEQPVIVDIGGDHQPWKPCKGMRRLLAKAWGTNTDTWTGHRVELYNDPNVTWAGEKVGGIRVSAISGISSPMRYVMRTSKKGTTSYDVKPLQRGTSPAEAREKFLAYAAGKGVEREQIDAFLQHHGTALEKLSPDELRTLARDLEDVRAFGAESEG